MIFRQSNGLARDPLVSASPFCIVATDRSRGPSWLRMLEMWFLIVPSLTTGRFEVIDVAASESHRSQHV
jgi:hypothetical protein